MNLICQLFGHKVKNQWPEIWFSQVQEGNLLDWKIYFKCRSCKNIYQWPKNIKLGTKRYPTGLIYWIKV